MGCCGGGHSSNKHNHSENVSSKNTFFPWLIGIIGIVGLIYLFNL